MEVRSDASVSTWRRLKVAGVTFALILAGGSFGYWTMGMNPLDAVYQTVTTVTTVGFRELKPFGAAEQVFTLVLIVLGVGTALYTFTLFVEAVIEGQLGALVGRKRMDRNIAALTGHVIICGLGRVGRSTARALSDEGRSVVVVDRDQDRLAEFADVVGRSALTVHGDATLDAVLRQAGIERAGALVTALAADADNLFVTLSGRALSPDLFIVTRAREEESVAKFERAGADRVVNPQELGAQRMTSFITSPKVAKFVDVMMHDHELEFRLQDVEVPVGSPVAGRPLGELQLREATGAMVFALRGSDGGFVTNPGPETLVVAGATIIAIGTDTTLATLTDLVVG